MVARAGLFEDVNGLLGVAPEEGAGSSHGVLRDGLLRVHVGAGLGVMRLHVAPTADLEQQLAMVRPLGRHAVEFGQVALLTVLADGPLPVRSVGHRRSWFQSK